MKLKNKILISIGIAWALFLIITYNGLSYFLTNSFLNLEETQSIQDLKRTDQALQQISNSLYTFTSDWAHWNDLYSYIQGNNPAFISNNFTTAAFINSTINFLSYWNSQNKLIAGTGIDTDTGHFAPYPKGLEKSIYPGSLLLPYQHTNNDIRGFLAINDGIIMIASTAITDGTKTQTPLGIAIAGRLLTNKIIQQIQDITNLSTQLIILDMIAKDKNYQTVFNVISNNQTGKLVTPTTDKVLQAFTVIRDINQKPIGMLMITEPRSIYLTGIKAIRYYLVCFILLGFIFSMLMLWLIRILIIKRLEKLNDDVSEIREKKELSKRVNTSGNDELASVAKSINSMLDIIQASHERLENHVQERTHELQKTNVQLQQEIIERKSAEKELITHKEHLVRLAHYDSLTTLPNRVFFNEVLNKAISQASRHNKLLAILFIDLDRFKTINDALGHSTGDLVLKEIATRFAKVLRTEDMLARLGGDEFIVLLNDIDQAKHAGPVAEKLLHICAKPIKINSHEFFLSASIGICIFPNDGICLEDLQRNADMAMYKAKKSGGNAYEYFTREMNIEAHEHIKLESALRNAIKNNEFILHYQPKYNLTDGIIAGVEALIRWESPEYGFISPSKFIPLAEETGLIMQIGEWVLRSACSANKSWQDAGYQPIPIAVNLSPKQFRNKDIAHNIKTILNETALEPHYLELEITETAVMDDVDQAIRKLKEIEGMGVKIAIDDFGTGYTSISNLKHYPVSILKIDQVFIKGIPNNQDDTAITAAVIALAHNMNLKVVAEGVESAEQLQFLADHDCDIVQGYYLSRPLPEAKLVSQLSKQVSLSS